MRPFACVSLHVFLETSFGDEVALTDGAAEGLLSGVHADVRFEVEALYEAFGADGAGEGLLSSVRAQVTPEVSA